MRDRILVTQAGSGAATNLVTSLRSGTPGVFIAGCHHDPFVLKKSTADVNYLLPPTHHAGYLTSLSRVVRREQLTLVFPVGDTDVAAISRFRQHIGTAVFLPRPRTLSICYDKLRLARRLRARGVPAPASYPVTDLDSLDAIFARFPTAARAWCRARHGAGSLGAAPVASAAHARAWIWLWSEARGVTPDAFMVAEYLPGRDFACQSLWDNGSLVLIKTTERLAYVDGGSRLSGTSSVASLHKTVRDERLVRVAAAAVHSVDSHATGAFSIDLKENADGVPCVTEINGGRLLSGTTIFDLVGHHNMSSCYVDLGTRGRTNVTSVYDCVEGLYGSRDLDTLPHVFDAQSFWTGWRDERSTEAQWSIQPRTQEETRRWERRPRPPQRSR
jgi:carbamoyl-phosphate synthase large subunit